MFLVPIKMRPFKFNSYLILIVFLISKNATFYVFVGIKKTIKIK